MRNNERHSARAAQPQAGHHIYMLKHLILGSTETYIAVKYYSKRDGGGGWEALHFWCRLGERCRWLVVYSPIKRTKATTTNDAAGTCDNGATVASHRAGVAHHPVFNW